MNIIYDTVDRYSTLNKVAFGSLLALGATATVTSAKADDINNVKGKTKKLDDSTSALANKNQTIIALTNGEKDKNAADSTNVTPIKIVSQLETFSYENGNVAYPNANVTYDTETGLANYIAPPEIAGYYPNMARSTIKLGGGTIYLEMVIDQYIKPTNPEVNSWQSLIEYLNNGEAAKNTKLVDVLSSNGRLSFSIQYSTGEFKGGDVKDVTYDGTDGESKKPVASDFIDTTTIKEPDRKSFKPSNLTIANESDINYKKSGKYDVDIEYLDDQKVEHHQTAKLTVIAGEFKGGNTIDQTYDSSDSKATRPLAEDYIDVSSIKEPDGKPYDKNKLLLDDNQVDYSKAGKYTVTISYTDDYGEKHDATATISVLEGFAWDKPKNQIYDSSNPDAKAPIVDDYIDVSSIKEPDGKAYDKSKLILDDGQVNYSKKGEQQVTITYIDDQGVEHAATATITIVKTYSDSLSTSNSRSESTSIYDSTSADTSKHNSESNSEIINDSNKSDSESAWISKNDSESLSELNSRANSGSDGAISDSISKSESTSKNISDSNNSKSNSESDSVSTSKSNSVSNDSDSASESMSDSKSTSTSKSKSDSDHSDSTSVSDSKSGSISNSSDDSNSDISRSASISGSDSNSSSNSKSNSEGSDSASASTSDSTSTSLIKADDPDESKSASDSTKDSDSLSKQVSDSNNEDSTSSLESKNDSVSNSSSSSKSDSNASDSASDSKKTSKSGSDSNLKSNSDDSKSASTSGL
ncbi:hypothetical protein JC2156_16400 [Weissella koreensis KCTC 3621]|uniref:hypothetical protein n=1 Tax=Weissella koreensis TaxID=165096 RepID=UPI00026F44A3|nr:hypothetical protein [Weissella koreensis]EJF34360.1 hypothetical protein JC2156_16400 [Weissella koreensis KCTC 3621]